jgi:hypothetical protein
MRPSRCWIVSLAAVMIAGLIAGPAAAGPTARYQHAPEDHTILLPDPTVTPGKAVIIDQATVCATRWGLDRRHVTDKMKAKAYIDYGAKKKKDVCCEVDHLVPRDLGGADAQENLWAQPWVQARLKDRLEVYLNRQVCAGRMTLKTAQEAIRSDWHRAYLKMMRERKQ